MSNRPPVRAYNLPLEMWGQRMYFWTLAIWMEALGLVVTTFFLLVLRPHWLYITLEAVQLMMLIAVVRLRWAWVHERPPFRAVPNLQRTDDKYGRR